jgi:CheY-specific phosphatase CheX
MIIRKKGKHMKENIKSKVLVYDTNTGVLIKLKKFCDQNNLIGLRTVNSKDFNKILKLSIDLGAILINDSKGYLQLARRIRKSRNDLPIFLRKENHVGMSGLSQKDQMLFAGTYNLENLNHLEELIEKYLFNVYFPSDFVREIQTLTTQSIKSILPGTEVICTCPYLVHDKIIYGEIMSIMPLEGVWCRGYMLIQANYHDLDSLLGLTGHIMTLETEDHERIRDVLGELTNLIWGAFKRHFVDEEQKIEIKSQVPFIINHQNKYITFGEDKPYLCFKYSIGDESKSFRDVSLYQKFIFHLGWDPKQYKPPKEDIEKLVEGGTIELF